MYCLVKFKFLILTWIFDRLTIVIEHNIDNVIITFSYSMMSHLNNFGVGAKSLLSLTTRKKV